MKKKSFLLVIFIFSTIFCFFNPINYESIVSTTTRTENSNLDINADFSGNEVLAPGEHVAINVGYNYYFYKYYWLVWNLTSDQGLKCLFFIESQYERFNDSLSYSCYYPVPEAVEITSIENEPFLMPQIPPGFFFYYFVFWNNGSSTAIMNYEITNHHLSAVILDMDYTSYDRDQDGYLDSVYVNFSIDFNFNRFSGTYNPNPYYYDEIDAHINCRSSDSYLPKKYYVGYGSNNFSYDVGSMYYLTYRKVKLTVYYNDYDPFNEFSSDDSMTIEVTTKLFEIGHAEYILTVGLIAGIGGGAVILGVSIPLTVRFLRKRKTAN